MMPTISVMPMLCSKLPLIYSAKDFWFIFDLAIAFDTWVMLVLFAIARSGGNAGGPRIFVVFQNMSASSSRTFGSSDENHSRNSGRNPRDRPCCFIRNIRLLDATLSGSKGVPLMYEANDECLSLFNAYFHSSYQEILPV